MPTKKKTVKKKTKPTSSGDSQSKALGLNALKAKVAALEKEITKNAANEAMGDMLEDKVEVLEKEVEQALHEGKISEMEAKALNQELDRLEDIVD